MSNEVENPTRRRVLVGASLVVGGVGGVSALTPFVASWNPSAKARAAGAPVKADISKLEPGGQVIVAWRGKPVWIVRRTAEALANLAVLDDSLADPDSAKSVTVTVTGIVGRPAPVTPPSFIVKAPGHTGDIAKALGKETAVIASEPIIRTRKNSSLNWENMLLYFNRIHISILDHEQNKSN